jgi:pimeloyl-ACP methyl ester carboxylesterase
MLTLIDTRELVTLETSGIRLRGTYHLPADASSGSRSSANAQNRSAVLFLNSLALPRAATGDSAAYWAESLAVFGYPAFRFDLPGLGDSDGEATTDILSFINSGGYASTAAALAQEIVQRYSVSGVVVAGHCAGAVSALYAAASSPECRGLILMDPYFHLPVAKRPKVREELSGWVRRSKLGRLLSNLYDRANHLRLFFRGSALPGNANTRLLGCWRQVASAGLPILLLKAPGIKAQGAKPRVGEFDYIQHAIKIAGRRSRVTSEFVQGADHSFANCAGRIAVEHHFKNWLTTCCPLPTPQTADEFDSVSVIDPQLYHAAALRTAAADADCALENR